MREIKGGGEERKNTLTLSSFLCFCFYPFLFFLNYFPRGWNDGMLLA